MNHVYVAGSINMDVIATAARYPKMGETVPGREIFFFPGGKGSNQAVSAAKLGAPTTLIGCLGEDAFGRELSTFLSSQGIDLTNLRYSMETHTGTAVIKVVRQRDRGHSWRERIRERFRRRSARAGGLYQKPGA
jgi:ribokinase